jgi:hypothetical protein
MSSYWSLQASSSTSHATHICIMCAYELMYVLPPYLKRKSFWRSTRLRKGSRSALVAAKMDAFALPRLPSAPLRSFTRPLRASFPIRTAPRFLVSHPRRAILIVVRSRLFAASSHSPLPRLAASSRAHGCGGGLCDVGGVGAGLHGDSDGGQPRAGLQDPCCWRHGDNDGGRP